MKKNSLLSSFKVYTNEHIGYNHIHLLLTEENQDKWFYSAHRDIKKDKISKTQISVLQILF